MASEPQELKTLQALEYTSWGAHAAEELSRHQQEQEDQLQFGLSGACAGLLNKHIAVLVGGRELPFETFRSSSRLDLFDLTSNSWLKNHDVDGAFPSRVGHTVVTVGDNAYAFGGEQLGLWAETEPLRSATEHSFACSNDVHELSFADSVLHCRAICTPAPSHDPAGDLDAHLAPCDRAWHASAAVTHTSGSEPGTKSDAVLVLGGKDSSGKLLADVWLLALSLRSHAGGPVVDSGDNNKASSAIAPHWIQISPTGSSPLPLAYHSAVAIGDAAQVVVIGGIGPSGAILESVFVLDLVGNAWSTLSFSPSPSPPISASSTNLLAPEPHLAPALTAKCCFTAVSLVLPIESSASGFGNVVLFNDDTPIDAAADEQHAQFARDTIFIFGGFSAASPALPTTSYVLLDVASSSMCELSIPNAGLQSYSGHACTASADRKSVYVFGGIDPRSNRFLETTSALHFWRPQPLGDGLGDGGDDTNAVKTKRFDNGDVYVGEMMALSVAGGAARHGRGKCTYASGDEYDGEWECDQRCGHGALTSSSGDVYVGQWEADQYHGYGILERRHGAGDAAEQPSRVEVKHDGHWACGDKVGSGTTTYSDGSQLVAKWHSGGLVRDGRLDHFDDGNSVCRYVGQVTADGLPDGQGASEHVSGESYNGQWRAGKRCGHGVATLLDGTTYTGEWRSGKRNGFGSCEFARSRDVYTGKWVGGVRCGRGVCAYANGSAYDGEWRDDKCHGHGRFTFAGGDARTFYEGSWQENRFCGDGALVLNEGGGEGEEPAEAATRTLSSSSSSSRSLRSG
ncbi:hypothetical protein PybrP1_012738 [[Pythium] brassicae (nom. inval.)]|nr:hypothetical protein PybrP1_012738 [[Pythium] brassicae (nom. inval.)]